jgi:hypothetical protein
MKRFCTAVNCMDGRVQLPVIQYLQRRFGADYVDVISEPGPNRILAEGSDSATVGSIERRLSISVEGHRSVGIAVVGHHDCAGNPTPEAEQRQHTAAAVQVLRNRLGDLPVIGLWVDENGRVSEMGEKGSS